MTKMDLERRRVLLASATLAALAGGGMSPRLSQDEQNTDQDVPEKIMPKQEHSSAAITPEVIAHAELLAGISFTASERTVIAETIGQQIAIFAQRIKAGELPNDLAPASTFKAMPAGRSPDRATSVGDPLRITAKVGALPDSDSAIAFSPLTHLATWFRRGELSSTRLTKIYLQRIRRSNPTLKCVITITEDVALKQARKADTERAAGIDLGPLHGMPYAAKDIIDTANIPTTWGAEPFKDHVPNHNAWVVEKLKAAGAVLIAKTSVGALAYGDIWFGGTTKNPWNLNQGSSGSSAGSASGTAAGLFAFSLGTETYGSIVSPCMRCGATGLRPTFGRVPRSGVMSLCWSLDKIGPICRSVADTALVLAVINGMDNSDPSSVDEPFNFDANQNARGLRVGWNPSWFADAPSSDRQVLDHLRDAGCELVEISLPDLPYQTLLVPLFAEAAAAFESLSRSNRDDELSWQAPEAWPNTFRQSWFVPAVELVQAERVRRTIMNAMADIFESVDALATPSFAANLLLISNGTGHPALVQPTAFRDNQPHGFTLIGRLFDEGTLCRLGQAIETRSGASSRHPDI